MVINKLTLNFVIAKLKSAIIEYKTVAPAYVIEAVENAIKAFETWRDSL